MHVLVLTEMNQALLRRGRPPRVRRWDVSLLFGDNGVEPPQARAQCEPNVSTYLAAQGRDQQTGAAASRATCRATRRTSRRLTSVKATATSAIASQMSCIGDKPA